jgi:hypothetical protein
MMSSRRQYAAAPLALALGVSLMMPTGAPPAAADGATTTTANVLLLRDFKASGPDLGWYVQNDNVMGGRSEGGFEIRERAPLLFSGSTNTDGGGFSSIRTRSFAPLDLSKYDGIELRVKADGRQYTWQLQTRTRYRGYEVGYWAAFDTVAGKWTTVRIPFSRFYPQVRGFRLEGPALDPSDITEFGLYIYDQKDGPFQLQLDSISAYADASP